MAIQHYRGGCQCGAVVYDVDVDLDDTITCNCSRCQRLGFVLAFTPRASLKLSSGEDNLTEYRFNRKQVQHLFCRICGVESFALGEMPEGTPIAAINVNCLDGVDPRSLESKHVDGRSF